MTFVRVPCYLDRITHWRAAVLTGPCYNGAMTADAIEGTPRGRAAQGQQSRALYNAAPNTCRQRSAPILTGHDEKLSEVRKRKFCGRSCAVTHT